MATATITVVRGLGDKRGTDIYDPLLTSLSVMLARGRNELDETAHGFQTVTLVCKPIAGVRRADVVEVHDSDFGETWYGKVVGIAHQTFPPATTLQVRRPTVAP